MDYTKYINGYEILLKNTFLDNIMFDKNLDYDQVINNTLPELGWDIIADPYPQVKRFAPNKMFCKLGCTYKSKI